MTYKLLSRSSHWSLQSSLSSPFSFPLAPTSTLYSSYAKSLPSTFAFFLCFSLKNNMFLRWRQLCCILRSCHSLCNYFDWTLTSPFTKGVVSINLVLSPSGPPHRKDSTFSPPTPQTRFFRSHLSLHFLREPFYYCLPPPHTHPGLGYHPIFFLVNCS